MAFLSWITLNVIVHILVSTPHCLCQNYDILSLTPTHAVSREFFVHMQKCKDVPSYCDINEKSIFLLAVKMSNEYAKILLHDRVQSTLIDAFYFVSPQSIIGQKLSHMLSVLYFAQGGHLKSKELWPTLNMTDVIALRSYVAQEAIMFEHERSGTQGLFNYTTLLGQRFYDLLGPAAELQAGRVKGNSSDSGKITSRVRQDNGHSLHVRRDPPTAETEEILQTFLLSEAQGGIRVQPRFSDLILTTVDLSRPMGSSQHFDLGICLSKLGLFDLAQHHVSLSASPWDPMYHKLRYTLSLPHVYDSMRMLARSINNFEQQIEQYILRDTLRSSAVKAICLSFSDSGMVLGVLPLLHLAGYSAPRHEMLMGYSPVAMPVLLSEFYSSMCSLSAEDLPHLQPIPPLLGQKQSGGTRSLHKKIRVGIVSGSFDSISGRIMIGMLEKISSPVRTQVELIAMCFPTPRDPITDRAKGLFEGNINLYPSNRTETLKRIQSVVPDVLLFADIGQDCRTFALAHYRLAPFQMALWGWGGTMGISTVDYYFFPDVFWTDSKCRTSTGALVAPQELYTEQVLLLEGLPPVARVRPEAAFLQEPDAWAKLQERLLLPPLNRSHIYIFPGSVRQVHPEMDAAISILLKTDHLAVIIFTAPLMGRDMLPPLHHAVRHDQLHPIMPIAAVAKLRARLMPHVGDAISRLRFLPPIDDNSFHLIRSYAVAVLDSFPVGMHLPVLEAMVAGVPVVSAPLLQECTNSYAKGIAASLDLGIMGPEAGEHDFYWPTSPEDYAVLAMRLARDPHLRRLFDPRHAKKSSELRRNTDHAAQVLSFIVDLHMD